MRTGKTTRSFVAKDSRGVVLSTPTWDDLDDFLALIKGGQFMFTRVGFLQTGRVPKNISKKAIT
jgi:hypothetical protein